MKQWVVVFKSCDDCGPQIAVVIFDHSPTAEEINLAGQDEDVCEFNFSRANCTSRFVAEVDEWRIGRLIKAEDWIR